MYILKTREENIFLEDKFFFSLGKTAKQDMLKIKRAYDKYSNDDGYRVLVDRLWPRGVSKEKAHIDLWLKEIAPTTELRKWFAHDIKKWEEFIEKYKKELRQKSELLKQLKDLEEKNGTLTLIFAAKDEAHNEAIVIHNLLTK